MPSRIIPNNQSLVQRAPRVQDKSHLEFIRSLPCVICMQPGVDAAHIRYADERYGKRDVGMAEKPSDKWVIPLCRKHHTAQHSVNEVKFWSEYGIDPLAMALALHSVSPDSAVGESVVSAWNRKMLR